MSLIHNLISRLRGPSPIPSRHQVERHIYTIDIGEQVEQFLFYHRQYSHSCAPDREAAYVGSVIENMIAHFEYRDSAVQSFVGHYAQLITGAVSMRYMYHPLSFLKPMDNDAFERYVYCLYGFAEAMFRLLETHGMYNARGILRASFEAYQSETLYLIVRPEVPDAALFA